MSRQHAQGAIARAFAGEPWGYSIRRAVQMADTVIEALEEEGFMVLDPAMVDRLDYLGQMLGTSTALTDEELERIRARWFHRKSEKGATPN